MEKCERCGKTEEQVRLFDGIYVNETVKICERCSLISNIPIIKRPDVNQLKDSEKPYGVRTRLMNMNHLYSDEKKKQTIQDTIKELESKPELEQPEELVFKLVDNFHWIIQTERRRKGLTNKQLADSIGESEGAIKLLEKGIVPNKSINLITAIEQFLKIKLIRRDMIEKQEEKNSVYKTPEIKPVNQPKPLSFGKETQDFKMRDLQRLNEKIEKDFTSGIKSKEDVGKEQTEDLGREDTAKIKRTIFKERSRNITPTIYELMKRKEEKEKTSITGKDIDIVDENKQ